MDNAPRVQIEYLVNYDLIVSGTENSNLESSEFHELSNLEKINDLDAPIKGKKGFHLCGGSVDPITGEESGCLLNGTYTLYSASKKAYNGIMGNELSNSNYEFNSPQYLTFKTANDNTYIQSLFVYFDPVAGEYATNLHFSNAINADGTIDYSYTSAKKIYNNKMIFIYNFGEKSNLKQITLNFDKWSKKNSLLKILKIVTGYTGKYDYSSIMKLNWTEDMFSDEKELRFGVSFNSADVEIIDKDKIVGQLYKKDMIFKDITASVYIDDLWQGDFYVQGTQGYRGENSWVFESIDKLERIKGNIIDFLQFEPLVQLSTIIEHVFRGTGFELEWSDSALEFCNNFIVEYGFIESGSTFYDALLKCCQVGLLRIYVRQNKIRITWGL